MQGLPRKIVYVSLFELMALAISSTGLAAGSGRSMALAGTAAVASSLFAVAWNLAYNHLFERWEARQPVRGRSLARRVAHALGFELGFLVVLVPSFAWWFDISLRHALVLNLGLAAFFLAFTFVFSWAFDAVFGLPRSAQASAPPPDRATG